MPSVTWSVKWKSTGLSTTAVLDQAPVYAAHEINCHGTLNGVGPMDFTLYDYQVEEIVVP